MTSEERDLITGLFSRLRTADSNNNTPKDQEAAQLIGQLTGQQPSAPYLLVQTLLVQEHALANAQARITQLEQQAAQAQKAAPSSGGGFLAGLFGHSPQPSVPQGQGYQGQMPPQAAPQPSYTQQAPPPYPTTTNMAPSAGGGFLKGALGTAAGVAGGALLFEGISNLLGHNAGPFGGGGGLLGGMGGGFLGGGHGGYGMGGGSEIIENNEVVNNYYNDDGGRGGVPEGVAENPAHPGHEEARYDGNAGGNFTDAGFDSSNPFDQQANIGLGNDTSSMDNNYDLDNPDANGGGFFDSGDSASNDFSGGNDDGNV